MTPAARCTLDDADYASTGYSHVIENGRRIGRVLGCRIDAQFDAGDAGTVLFVSPDTIFVGLLHVLLVRGGRVVEQLKIGSGGAEGLATEFASPDATTITFRFPFDELKRLKVERRSGLFGLRSRSLVLA